MTTKAITNNEISSKYLLTHFKECMDYLLQGVKLAFTYKGYVVDLSLRKPESKGQKLARLLMEDVNEMPDTKSEVITSNKELYKSLKKYD